MKTCLKCKTTKSVFDFVLFDEGLSKHCRKCLNPVIQTDEEIEKEILTRLLKQQRKEWNQNNKHLTRRFAKQRYNALKQRTPKWLTKDEKKQIDALYEQAVAYSALMGIPHHVDHIVPLQGENVSGLHVPWNLQILKAEDNFRKKNRFGEHNGKTEKHID